MDEKFNLDDLKQMISDYDTRKTEFTLDDIIKTEQEIEDIKPSNEINSDVIKPDSVSITGAFEAIRSEKSNHSNDITVKSVEPQINKDYEIEDDNIVENDAKPSVEIVAEIEPKRYFNTEQFESIKNKESVDMKESIASFTKGLEEEDDGEEEYINSFDETEEIDDFETLDEREDILLDLKKMNSSAAFKSSLTFILTLISGLMFLALQLGVSVPGLAITSGSKLFLTFVLSISVVASIVNINSLFKGLLSLVKLKCTPETMIFLAFVSNTLLNLFYLLGNTSFNGDFISFDFVYMLLLMFNIMSKKILAKNILKNFMIASSEGQKTVVDRPEMEEIANDIILETGNGGDILYATKSRFVTDFIHNSFKDFDICSKHSPFYTFCCVIIFALSVLTYFLTKNFVHMLAYSAGAFCVVTPLLLTFSQAVPIFNNSNRARRFGGAIVGSESAYALEDAQTLIVDDSDVFNVALNGIRMFGDTEIDECILYLCSLYNTVGGPLKNLFTDMLSESIPSIPRCDEVYYHETMGFSCLIHSKVFVVGNKNLMNHFGIEVDDSEFEIIYQQKSKNVLFVAYDGKLMGVFLLTYSLSHGVSKAFSLFENDQINVAIAERDANITTSLLYNNFKTSDKSLFSIMNFRTARNCFSKFELKNKTPSILLSNTGLKGIAAAFHGCRAMLFAMKANQVIKTISSLMAIVLITFLLVFSAPSLSLPMHIIAYQLLWSLPILFVSLFSK